MCPFLSNSQWLNVINLPLNQEAQEEFLNVSAILPTLSLASKKLCVGESGDEDSVLLTLEPHC